MFATKPDDLSWSPRSHLNGGRGEPNPTNCPLASTWAPWQACKSPAPVNKLMNISFRPWICTPIISPSASPLGNHKLTLTAHKIYLLKFYIYRTLFFFAWPVRLCAIIPRVLLTGKCIHSFHLWPSIALLLSSLTVHLLMDLGCF